MDKLFFKYKFDKCNCNFKDDLLDCKSCIYCRYRFKKHAFENPIEYNNIVNEFAYQLDLNDEQTKKCVLNFIIEHLKYKPYKKVDKMPKSLITLHCDTPVISFY